MDEKRIKELEEAIAELKSRWPKHSVKPAMWQQLEALEEQLEQAQRERMQEHTEGHQDSG